jgi:hypothetical protein
MKKLIKKTALIITAAVLSVCFCVDAFAQGTVTYDGSAKKYVFEPGSSYSPTDLFTDFKNVMPGDSITQQITVKNSVKNNAKIKLYLKSSGAQDGSQEFLSQMNLKVSQNGGSNLFDAPAAQTDGLTDWTYLGTFYSGAEVDLNVTLNVPIEMGNEFQKSVGLINWQFKAEELPVEPDDPKPPKTGDTATPGVYVLLAAISAGAIIIILLSRRRSKNTK